MMNKMSKWFIKKDQQQAAPVNTGAEIMENANQTAVKTAETQVREPMTGTEQTMETAIALAS